MIYLILPSKLYFQYEPSKRVPVQSQQLEQSVKDAHI